MEPNNLETIQRVHMIGVGGIGMSALAQLLAHEGKIVTGSDRGITDEVLAVLEAKGIKVYKEHAVEHVAHGTDLIIYSDAVREGTLGFAEREAGKERGIPERSYYEALGAIANQYYLIAVAGSHGKTTTTAMTIDIFEAAGLDPSAIVGSLRAKTGSNFRAGEGKYFISEADEYMRHFLNFEPHIVIITNVEYEHVYYYKDLADVQSAFRTLVEKIPEDGFVITDPTSETIKPIIKDIRATVIDYREYIDPLMPLTMPGLHNRKNAAAAIAAASTQGIEVAVAKAALQEFRGTWRRFEYKGTTKGGAIVHDDYGHHPTEVAATLQGARDMYPDRKITLVFQPHTYSRFRELFDDFVAKLAKADQVILVPIYAARETNTHNDSSERLATALRATGRDAHYVESFEEVIAKLTSEMDADDLILVMGAGDVTNIAADLTKE